MTTIADQQTMVARYNSFQNSYFAAGVALNNVISDGMLFYNDPSLPVTFPNSYEAYQTYLVTLGQHISTFLETLPVVPALDG